jgi:hypothetical protein
VKLLEKIHSAKAGFKAFVWNDEFYVMGEAGAAFAVTNDYKQTSLILAPSIGYATKYIDVSLRYEHYSDFRKMNNNGTIGRCWTSWCTFSLWFSTIIQF